MEEADHLKRSNKKVKSNHLATPTPDVIMTNETNSSENPHFNMVDVDELCSMDGDMEEGINHPIEAGNLKEA